MLLLFIANWAISVPINGVNIMKQTKIVTFVLITIFLAFLSCFYIYNNGLNGPPIRSDGFGYYSYLSSIFIDGDLSFETAMANVQEGVSPKASYGMGRHPKTGKMFVKYLPGTALMESPFFLLAHIFTFFSAYTSDGYSTPYQMAIVFSGIFYLSLGIFFLFHLLIRKNSYFVTLLTLLLVVYATNVFHYATYDSSFSHIFSFALFSIYLFLLDKYRSQDGFRKRFFFAALIGISFGLITIIRAPNAIVLLLWIGLITERIFNYSFENNLIYEILIFLLFAFVVLIPLFAYWQETTGRLFINSYSVFPLSNGAFEGFNWSKPEIFNFLFSIERGLFFWTPISLLAFAGLILLFSKDRVFGIAICSILLIHIYICSSWWCWYFGGSFGSRPFVEMMPVLSLPLALSIGKIRKLLGKAWTLILCFIPIILNLTLMYSYWRGYIPFSGTTWATLQKLPSIILF